MTPAIASTIWLSGMIIAIGVDIFLAKDRITGNTWSEITRFLSERAFVLAWTSGVINGHWFHWFKEGQGFHSHRMIILIALTIPITIISILIGKFIQPFPNWVLILALQAGIFAGALLWRV